VQRDELSLKALFSEEAGAVLQVPLAQRDAVMQALREAGLSVHSHVVGSLNKLDEIQVYRDGKSIYSRPRAGLAQQWSEVSRRIIARRDNPSGAQGERVGRKKVHDPGFSPGVGI